MDRSKSVNNTKLSPSRRTRCAAAMLCAALAGLGLARSAAAQGPQATSPIVPTPYQSPLFHAGGADPALSLTPPFLNPLYGQLQGTPTGTVPDAGAGPGFPTQIPSFVLGNYDPARPPGLANATTYFPNHFADGGIFQWQAPFSYNAQAVGMVTVDDTAPAPTAGPPAISGFALTPAPGNWEQVVTGPAAGTAAGGEYQRLKPNVDRPNTGGDGAAVWSLTATDPGSFSVYFHIPDQIADINGDVETRSSQVTYQIAVSGANSQTGAATVSQTEANSSQFLAGPFQLAVGDTVTVTLRRDATHNQNTNKGNGNGENDYLIADSMTLQQAIGDVQSAPTAINYDSYPEDFKRAKYWGVAVPTGTTNPVPASTVAGVDNAPPDVDPASGGAILRSGATNVNDKTFTYPAHVDPLHRIRQLVYFGRQDVSFANGYVVDDNAAVPTSGKSGFSAPSWSAVPDTTGTATNGQYHRISVNSGGTPATWTVVAPNGGDYFVTVHIPGTPAPYLNNPTEIRIGTALYTVTYPDFTTGNPTTQTFTESQVTAGGRDVTLPTGPIPLSRGQVVTVSVTQGTGTPTTANTYIVADSVRIATGGQGAIYCVDGFTGGVVWRFPTPGSANGSSAPVFSSPAVTHINVLVTPAGPGNVPPAVYQNRLVVIVGDNNGLVYCLDAIGNGDGTSNSRAIDPNTGQPIYFPQPGYAPFTGTNGVPANAPVFDQANPHVGTTGTFWIYRPDANRPKYVTGAKIGQVKRDTQTKPQPILDPLSDLPVPAAFGTASPTIFVNPDATTAADTATGSIPYTNNTPPSNSIVYIGNSNGVLYALDGTGVTVDGSSTTAFEASGDRFNVSQDLRRNPNIFPAVAADGIAPTPQPLWWFSLRGADPNSTNNASFADIESAPALRVSFTPTAVPGPTATTSYAPKLTVYIGSAHELEATSNIGRLYALNGITGPAGNSGLSDPTKQSDPTKPTYTGPGSFHYNVAQVPQINKDDITDWSFPDANNTKTGPLAGFKAQSSNLMPRPALGNITGSPVVFTNTNETGNLKDGTTPARTRIYIAANVGLEIPAGSAKGTAASARPDEAQTGRLWAVNVDGSIGTTTRSGVAGTIWSYPLANDPNNVTKDTVAEPQAPLGAFLHATPAMGFVRFPGTITNGDGSAYAPGDAVNTSILGQSVPMLYVATRGVNDSALYAIDVDGDIDLTKTPPADDTRLIYRPIPKGSIFQSSPVLVTNSSATTGGNGGSVYVISGNTLYDYSATPISNPNTGQAFPLIRDNKEFTGAGPLSSPTLSAFDVSDLENDTYIAQHGTNYPNVSDWVYFGDSSTGFCRGITPFDLTDVGIPTAIAEIVPPSANGVGIVDLKSSLLTYLVNAAHAGSASGADALPVGATESLPVYDWGQNVYIRFANVVPPGTDPKTFVHDKAGPAASPSDPITVYGDGGPITFDLSDSTAGAAADKGTVPAVTVAVPASLLTPIPNGFVARPNSDVTTGRLDSNLVDSNGTRYIGAYTYAISDGSARRNTPGATRRVLNVQQIVHVYTDTGDGNPQPTGATVTLVASVSNGNVLSVLDPATKQYKNTFDVVPPVDQPIFGILNPLALRGGGIPLALDPNPNNAPTTSAAIGGELGPFRGVGPPPAPGGGGSPLDDKFVREALANGNTILKTVPGSTSGAGLSPIRRPLSVTNPDTETRVVVTSTGLIAHNNSGDNFDKTTAPFPPIGQYTGASDNGLLATPYYGSVDQPFALDLADRSVLGLVHKTLRVKAGTISGGDAGLYWNDNSANFSGSGHDSVVNFLPWETAPVGQRIGANPSPDYPDISSSNIAATLYQNGGGAADLTGGGAYARRADANGSTDQTRKVYANPVQIHVTIPRYQPANQQLYKQQVDPTDNTKAVYVQGPSNEITPAGILSKNDVVFPMGYVTTRRIYVPNQEGFYREGAAFREFRVYTGVPPDFGMQMGEQTVDTGKVPSGFGVQTSQFPGLADPTLPMNVWFNPYNAAFRDHFQPLPVFNTGNVNLMNVHFDQRISRDGTMATISPLFLQSDSLDPLSAIQTWDQNLATGFDPYNKANSYLLRTSLDADIALRNPVLGADYAGPTFHKARVGDANPSTLTVPDVPHDNVFNAYGAYATSDPNPPLNNPNPDKPRLSSATSTTIGSAAFAAQPYVGIATPFGTPVGTYHLPTQLQSFEGFDLTGYSTYNGSGYNILYPPQYGGVLPGQGTKAGPVFDYFAFRQHPVSTTGTDVKVTVTEDRMTDGFTYGAVPQVDTTAAGPKDASNNPTSTPDFAPAAFRDPTSKNLSIYWTTGRTVSGSTAPFNIESALVPFTAATAAAPLGYFLPSDPTQYWWKQTSALPAGTGINSGLTIAQDGSTTYAFAVNVQTPPYLNRLFAFPVAPDTGVLGAGTPISSDPSQVKYGVKGLVTDAATTNFKRNLWAFWTATTRGRTAVYYNSQDPTSKNWIPAAGSTTPGTVGLLPVPAGLTAVSDPAPLLVFGPATTPTGTTLQAMIDVTYSGTSPDGNVDLYESRYQPDGDPKNPKPFQLVLLPFPAVTETLAPVTGNGWFQGRDVAWSRTSQLNVLVNGSPILYDTANAPLFSRAVFDKASGLLVVTGIKPTVTGLFGANPPIGGVTAYVDLATGRVRFTTPPVGTVGAFFSPLARRITTDSRADTGVSTFLDGNYKPNDAPGLGGVKADRRWYVWHKSGAGGAAPSASIYYKTQRLTFFLPNAIALDAAGKPIITVSVGGSDVSALVDVDYSRGRVYFPISLGGTAYSEGQQVSVTYTPQGGTSTTLSPDPLNTIQWQDEQRANDATVLTPNSIAGLSHIVDYAVPLDTIVNENNVSAFLDPDAAKNTTKTNPPDLSHPHKVWLFWNSTRNGTADLYYETIDPRFTAGP